MHIPGKKGDSRKAENYRPIAILPILYKLFSKVVCARVKDTLILAQSCDQAGFRPGYCCEDHLFTVTQLLEKTNEFNHPIWFVVVDFKKAFDTICHDSLWQALRDQGVHWQYIDVLKELYAGQQGQVLSGADKSRRFNIERGSKQGDPISPVLFNATLEQAMRRAKSQGQTRAA